MGSTTGSQAIAVNWTGATAYVAGAASFSGVNQTTPFANGTVAKGTTSGLSLSQLQAFQATTLLATPAPQITTVSQYPIKRRSG